MVCLVLGVWLKPKSQEIDQVVVVGRARLVSQRGDTLVYNAAAVRTMDGDETIRMLERLPGVAAYDLLNRGSNFTTTTYADYEMQRWQPSYGRYFTLNVGIRLNKPRNANSDSRCGLDSDSFLTIEYIGTFS